MSRKLHRPITASQVFSEERLDFDSIPRTTNMPVFKHRLSQSDTTGPWLRWGRTGVLNAGTRFSTVRVVTTSFQSVLFLLGKPLRPRGPSIFLLYYSFVILSYFFLLNHIFLGDLTDFSGSLIQASYFV